MDNLQKTIEEAYLNRSSLSALTTDTTVLSAIEQTLDKLEDGTLRVAQLKEGNWVVNTWVKQAILLYFQCHNSQTLSAQYTQFFDKVPLRFSDTTPEEFERLEVRIVPPATVRRGAFLAPKSVLMPSYINIGAYVGENTMVDTWATIGSCAQIGRNVHISGGVGIGGVLEPLQSSPTIIEDDCFIGARSEIVEGVIVGRGSVISMGVYIGQSTRIFDRETGEVHYGRIPENSVVVPGNLPSPDGQYSLYAAIIVKRVDDKTRRKTAINELLRIPDCKEF